MKLTASGAVPDVTDADAEANSGGGGGAEDPKISVIGDADASLLVKVARPHEASTVLRNE